MATKPRLVGLNRIAIEVGDVEEELRFYGSIFDFELCGSRKDEHGRMDMASVDLGDQSRRPVLEDGCRVARDGPIVREE